MTIKIIYPKNWAVVTPVDWACENLGNSEDVVHA